MQTTLTNDQLIDQKIMQLQKLQDTVLVTPQKTQVISDLFDDLSADSNDRLFNITDVFAKTNQQCQIIDPDHNNPWLNTQTMIKQRLKQAVQTYPNTRWFKIDDQQHIQPVSTDQFDDFIDQYIDNLAAGLH